MAAPTTLKKPTNKKVDLIEIKRWGEQLIIPEDMPYPDAIKTIQQKMEYEEEVVALAIPINGYALYDGLVAFHKALAVKYGWASMVPTPGFFGPQPPTMIGVDIGVGETMQVPWGSVELPHVEGRLRTGYAEKDGRVVFQISGKIKRKHENAIDDLVKRTYEILKTDSIYRSKAIRVRFKNDDGQRLDLPEIKFLDLSGVNADELIYSDDVMAQIKTNIFTPIQRAAYCRKQGIPMKRGILLAGPFGVGKTMCAYVTAQMCVENGWTYIAVDRADELADALRFAHLYGPVAVFCEDIDRVMRGERSISSDEMLNLVDGIESKNAELMVIFTTNDIDNIQPALLRHGRLDSVIHVTAPDAKAAIHLCRKYGRGLIPEDEDLTQVGVALAGKNAAAIREIVERSKLYAISLLDEEVDQLIIRSQALLDTAFGMEEHMNLLTPKEEDKRSDVEKAAATLADSRRSTTERLIEAASQLQSHPAPPRNGHLEAAEDLMLVSQN